MIDIDSIVLDVQAALRKSRDKLLDEIGGAVH